MLERDTRFAGWARPAGWAIINLAPCSGCGERVAWARSAVGSHYALERDGGRHAARCTEQRKLRARTWVKPRVGP